MADVSARSSTVRIRSHMRAIPTVTAAIDATIQSGAAAPNWPIATTTHPTSIGTATDAAGSQATVRIG